MENRYGGGSRIRTHGAVTLNGFQDRRFQPLSHPSGSLKNYLILIERKSRMPQMQGGKGEAVVNYREPFPTPQMGYHRLSPRGKQNGEKRHHHILLAAKL